MHNADLSGHGVDGKRKYKSVYGATPKKTEAKAEEVQEIESIRAGDKAATFIVTPDQLFE